MKTDRLFGIVYALLNGKTTATELARKFGVSKRTILRDIETLSVAGVPIYTTSGNGGGVAILDGYVLDKAVLSNAEREQIAMGLKMLLPTGQNELDKLGQMFAAADVKDYVEVDYSGWNVHLDKKKFDDVKAAVTGKRALKFSYPDQDLRYTDRTAYPLKLLFKRRNWYVQAFCLLRNDYRTFKINRMENIIVLDERFDAEQYSPPSVEVDWTQFENVRLKIVFAPIAAARVLDEFFPNEITKNEDGTFTVDTTMPLNDWVYGYIMSFGDTIIKLEPPSICAEIEKRVKNMLETYLKVT